MSGPRKTAYTFGYRSPRDPALTLPERRDADVDRMRTPRRLSDLTPREVVRYGAQLAAYRAANALVHQQDIVHDASPWLAPDQAARNADALRASAATWLAARARWESLRDL